MEGQQEKLIFVAGVPRSGTTLVQNILDCHPDIYGGPEFDRICNIIDLRRKLHRSIKIGRIDTYLNQQDVDKSIANLIKSFLSPVARKHNCSFASEKTPWNILAFKDLMEILPEAKFIYIIRYPHAVIASMIHVAKRAKKVGVIPPDFTKNISLACYYFESVLKLIYQLDKKYPGKILTIKYEKLLGEPLPEIKQLCSFIGVPFDERMLKPGDTDHPGQETMTKHGIWYSESMYNSNLDKNNIDKWKTQLNGVTKAFINYVFLNNPFIKKYGYTFSNKNISSGSKYLGFYKYKRYLKEHNFSKIPFRTLS
ncbi:MAG: sulfotransferase [Candidatus Aminicenantes bacterium]|nr:MAG: sulfotransferase [Candidatus Aminicenantes bacterium]